MTGTYKYVLANNIFMKGQAAGGIIIIFIIIALVILLYLASNTTPSIKTPQARIALSPSGPLAVQNNTYYYSPINLTIVGLSNNNNTIYQVKVSSSNPTDVYAVFAINNTKITQFNTAKIQNGLVDFHQIRIFGKNTVGVVPPAQFLLNFTLYYNGTVESSQKLIVNVT